MDLNPGNPVGCKGYLAATVGELLKDMWLEPDKESISPWKFKKVISKFAPQFSGYSQQDS